MDNIVIIRKELIEKGKEDPLLSLFSLFSVGHYVDNNSTCLLNWRVFEKETVMIYCEAGEGYIEDDRGFRSIKPGDLLIIAPKVPHRYGNKKGSFWTIGWAHVIGDHHDKVIQCRGSKRPILTIGSEMIKDSLQRLPRILAEESFGSLQLATANLLHAIQDLNYSQADELKHDDKILELKNFIEIAYPKYITLESLAKRIGLSKFQLIKRFNHAMGVSPIVYVNQRRVYHSTRMLSFTNHSIGKIAEKVGIQDAYYFSRLFKKIMGVSPRQYRKKGY